MTRDEAPTHRVRSVFPTGGLRAKAGKQVVLFAVGDYPARSGSPRKPGQKPTPMFFIVSLIALALAIAIAAIFGLQLHPEAVEEKYSVFVLTVFAFPTIATVYGGLTLIVCNLISSWLGWPELSLPWWPQRPDRSAVTISWYIIAGLGVFIGVIALVWYYARR